MGEDDNNKLEIGGNQVESVDLWVENEVTEHVSWRYLGFLLVILLLFLLDDILYCCSKEEEGKKMFFLLFIYAFVVNFIFKAKTRFNYIQNCSSFINSNTCTRLVHFVGFVMNQSSKVPNYAQWQDICVTCMSLD